MKYLADHGVVHGRLCADNVLVTSGATPTAKISNFGNNGYNLADREKENAMDDDDEDDYEQAGGIVSRTRFLPKWSSPETILDSVYNEHSDVWSFGVTAWECMSLGKKPYAGMTDTEMTMSVVSHKYRLPSPPHCPKSLVSLMSKCWHHEATDRPRFSDIVAMLESRPVNMTKGGLVDDLVRVKRHTPS